jgi:biopolymer transport protein ExbD
MAFKNNQEDSDIISEINITPLVDVMLVLMIIFLITAPLIKYSVEISLPKTENKINKINQPINLYLDKDGNIFWNDKKISEEEFSNKISEVNKDKTLQLAADKNVAYEHIAKILLATQKHEIGNIGFVIEEK